MQRSVSASLWVWKGVRYAELLFLNQGWLLTCLRFMTVLRWVDLRSALRSASLFYYGISMVTIFCLFFPPSASWALEIKYRSRPECQNHTV